ncbi:acyl carrier protein [Thioalkalivibrio sp. ALMg13-2]|uniref:acyl carrier protein n=1 Tax=Thioalkalivibrio sp. ALMg13-2 TaxID=1158167 RepID=UPI00039FD368|nr:acyl carrier protein [Thioalkalivibrio sp. ALMg13-2]
MGQLSDGAAGAERFSPLQGDETGEPLNAFLDRVVDRLKEAGHGELSARVMTDGVTVRMEDLGLDSLELLDLVMGLEEDFKVGLAIENLTNRMQLDEVFAEIQRLRREQGGRGAGIA